MIEDFFALFVRATQWLQYRPLYRAGYKEATRSLEQGAITNTKWVLLMPSILLTFARKPHLS